MKDYFRKAGDVVFADITGRGEGIVEFSNPESMEKAIKDLDDTKFSNVFDSSYIRVKLANKDEDDDRDDRRGRNDDEPKYDRDRDRDDN